jgi:subtilisin family serine protease
MRKINSFIVSLAILLSLLPNLLFAQEAPLFDENGKYYDLIVKFDQAEQNWDELKLQYSIVDYRKFAPFLSHAELNKIYIIKTSSAAAFEKLRIDPRVLWAEIDNIRVETNLIANDQLFTTDSASINQQWHLPRIQAPQGWDIKTGAPEVTVAVIDTGIDARHIDLNDGRVVAGRKVYCAVMTLNSCTTRILEDIPANTNSDDKGHGTAVASVIGAIGNNARGMTGVAWNIKLMPVKALASDGSGSLVDVAEGIVWAASHGADIINLSLGGPGLTGSALTDTAIRTANDLGAIVVAASGNENTNLDTSPASPVCNDGGNNLVVGVAATDYRDVKSTFSNYGSKCIDVSAPGTRIITAFFDPLNPNVTNAYAYQSGTSFAAPIVSAIAALLKSAFPNLSNDQIKARLKNADDISSLNATSCNDSACGSMLGAGRVNLFKALTSAAAPAPVNPTPAPEPPPIVGPVPVITAPIPSPAQTPTLSTLPVYRFWSDTHKTHFYTISEAEKNQIIATYASNVWRFEGVAYRAVQTEASTTCSSKFPVYRFWNNQRSSHFYTISEQERNAVLTQYSPGLWRYEGIAFCTDRNQLSGTKPVYRFWSDTHKTHFYTISEGEKNQIIATYASNVWRFEGVAFYAVE